MRVAIGVLLMVAAILGGASVLRGATARSAVIIAARAVEPGSVIVAKDLRVEEVALSGGVESIAASSMSGLVGRVAAEPLYPGKLLTTRSISSGPPVPAGYVAMSIALKPERAVGGTLRSGDRVAVVATSNAGRPDAASVLLFQKIPIVAVSTRSGGEGNLVIVTLQVRPEEARALAQARNSGEIDLLLLSGSE
jgi:Flp pilus assembly protein CpaB